MNIRYAAVLSLLPAAALGQPATFQGIGHLPGQARESEAAGISADNRVVIGSARHKARRVAIRWTADDGMEILEPEPGWAGDDVDWRSAAASADGGVIVGRGAGPATTSPWPGDFAFRWTAATGLVDLGRLPGAAGAAAVDVSADGSIVVGYSRMPNGLPRAFRWTAGAGIHEFLPPAGLSWPVAISGDGTAVAGNHNISGIHWTGAGGLQVIGSPELWPAAMSRNGQFVVGRIYSVGWPFRWSLAGGFLAAPAGLPGAYVSGASSVSDDGATVLGWTEFWPGVAPSEVFHWHASTGSTRPLREVLETQHGLNLAGWTLTSGRISPDGKVIVGAGRNPCGEEEGWIARLGTQRACYADCNGDGVLNLADLGCFQTRLARGDRYADCNGDCALNLADLGCFQAKFALGCP